MQHFPILYKYDDINHTFVLSNCGKTIKYIKSPCTGKRIREYYHKNLNTQVDCILYNLKKNKIKHFDMYNGRNLCINKKGVVSLIDFDTAVIDNNYLSETIKNRPENTNNYYEESYKRYMLEYLNQFNID